MLKSYLKIIEVKLFVFVKISIPSFTVSAVDNEAFVAMKFVRLHIGFWAFQRHPLIEAYLFTQVSNIWMRFLTRAPWTAPLLVALLQQTNT